VKLELRMSGGVAGVRRTYALDTDELDPGLRDELEGLAHRVELPADPPPAPGADRRQYDLTVEGPGGRRSGVLREGAMSEDAHALVARVREHGRPG
jgi:hypothetical protein